MRSPRRSAASSLRRSRRPTQERAAALLPRVRRYASECSSLIKSFRFRFDGVVLCGEQTAADVGLESGDQIDCSLIYWNGEEA